MLQCMTCQDSGNHIPGGLEHFVHQKLLLCPHTGWVLGTNHARSGARLAQSIPAMAALFRDGLSPVPTPAPSTFLLTLGTGAISYRRVPYEAQSNGVKISGLGLLLLES